MVIFVTNWALFLNLQTYLTLSNSTNSPTGKISLLSPLVKRVDFLLLILRDGYDDGDDAVC
jgi:hypothetical protein